MANQYVFTNEAILFMKDQFIDKVRETLNDYNPEDQDAKGVIAGIGGMMILLDATIQALNKDDDKDDQQ